MQYNSPTAGAQTGVPSSIGATQFNTFYWHKKAIIDAKKEMYFTPLAEVLSMPKHMGKEIKVLQYVPLLDDRNINDQGIDASGATILSTLFYATFTDRTYSFAVDADAIAAAAAINAVSAGNAVKSGAGPYVVTLTLAVLVLGATAAQRSAIIAAMPAASVTFRQGSGNLYGSSKDIGTIVGRLPSLSENGGRVNRVGHTRLERTGTITRLGFFSEFTKDTFDFDSDEELYGHMSRELVKGATEMSETVLQVDLLNGAGTVLYSGTATQDSEVTGEGGALASIVDYDDFVRLATILNDNRTPKQTDVITGSRMIDTRTISNGRIMYIGSEMESTVRRMVDPFDQPAFIPVSQYANAGTILNGEIGTIDQFRIVVVPEMLNWAGKGAGVTTNPGFRDTGDRYDIYPMLVVGAGSFTTIGFQTDGKTVKFKIITKMPGDATADRNEPFGLMGFSSIMFWYGTLIMRPERLAMIKSVARR